MRTTRQRRKRVEVEWADSVSHGRWTDPTTVKRGSSPVGCISVGYLVESGKDAITIAQSVSLSDDGEVEEYGHALTIPRSALVGEVRELAA